MRASNTSISAALAVHNEESNISACLSSLSWCDEVVVVDGQSSDNTARICRDFPGVRIFASPNNTNINVNKNEALARANGDWILIVDADERVPSELANEIRSVVAEDSAHDGYFLPRRNFFMGQWIRGGGWYPDHVLRLVRRGQGRFPAIHVHETLHVCGSVGYLKNALTHHSYPDLSTYLRKLDFYTSFEARRIADLTSTPPARRVPTDLLDPSARKPLLRDLWWRYAPLKPLLRFFLMYVIRSGFRDGRAGLTLALLSAMSDLISEAKAFEAQMDRTFGG